MKEADDGRDGGRVGVLLGTKEKVWSHRSSGRKRQVSGRMNSGHLGRALERRDKTSYKALPRRLVIGTHRWPPDPDLWLLDCGGVVCSGRFTCLTLEHDAFES